MTDFNIFTKMPKNARDLDKFIVAKGFKKLSNKSPNLVTLLTSIIKQNLRQQNKVLLVPLQNIPKNNQIVLICWE